MYIFCCFFFLFFPFFSIKLNDFKSTHTSLIHLLKGIIWSAIHICHPPTFFWVTQFFIELFGSGT